MESNINIGTLSGTIHHIRRNEHPTGDKVASFQIATQYCSRKKDGTPFCETTYHLVTAWEGIYVTPDMIDKLQEGQTIFAEGRWRNIAYEKCGDKIFTYELLVNRMQILKA